MKFKNVYEDSQRAEAYAKLDFPGTYYLAYRDLPDIISKHVNGKKAVDFGCGTGRSTRFLGNLGFDVLGIDISRQMINRALYLDPKGTYRLVKNGDFSKLQGDTYDLVLSVFTFDNIPTMNQKIENCLALARLLNSNGILVNLVSSPEIYTHEWASFSTKDFRENTRAKSGDTVRIIQTDIEDRRPVEDVVCSDDDYRKIYKKAGLTIVKTYKPLGKEDEPFTWINETQIAPWVIYVLKKKDIISKHHPSQKNEEE
jgi:trans-aconitate methyltransferase